MPAGLVAEVWNVFPQLRNATEANSEVPGATRKNSRRLTCCRFGRRWFLSVTCYRSVAFAQARLQELEIAAQSGENILLFGCAGFPRHVILEVRSEEHTSELQSPF